MNKILQIAINVLMVLVIIIAVSGVILMNVKHELLIGVIAGMSAYTLLSIAYCLDVYLRSHK